MVKGLAIRPKLFLVVTVPLVGLLATMAFSLQTLAQVKVTGPEYARIVQFKDLVADILPPPQYLVESYSVAQHIAQEADPAEVAELADQLSRLEQSYEERHTYWSEHLEEGDLRERLLTASYTPGRTFWDLIDQKLIPLARLQPATPEAAASRLSQMNQLVSGDLEAAFRAHEAAIIDTVGLSRAEEASTEQRTTNMVASRTRLLMILFAVAAALAGLVGVVVARAIQVPIRQLKDGATDAVEALTGADLSRNEIPQVAHVVVESRDETKDAADAFNTLLDTTIGLLATQARMRRTNQEMFVSLGRRNQNLVARQLKFIDQLERSETDPELLASLFRLDHLATRMRRNAESLLVIAGLESPRKWKNPVPALDVARSAAAEAEQFERIEFGDFDEVWVTGGAVANIVHLLAELIDNAVRYSPPDTAVTVSGSNRDDRFMLGIADLGMGMTAKDLEAVNARLAGRETTEAVPTAHLGLYVVATLAARHGVTVRLESVGGEGLTAWVELPAALLESKPSATARRKPSSSANPKALPASARAGAGSGALAKRAPQRGEDDGHGERQRPNRPAGPPRRPDRDDEAQPAARSSMAPMAPMAPRSAGSDGEGSGGAPTGGLFGPGGGSLLPPMAPVLPEGLADDDAAARESAAEAERTSAGFVRRVPQATASQFGTPAKATPAETARSRKPEDLRSRLESFSAGKSLASSSPGRKGEGADDGDPTDKAASAPVFAARRKNGGRSSGPSGAKGDQKQSKPAEDASTPTPAAPKPNEE